MKESPSAAFRTWVTPWRFRRIASIATELQPAGEQNKHAAQRRALGRRNEPLSSVSRSLSCCSVTSQPGASSGRSAARLGSFSMAGDVSGTRGLGLTRLDSARHACRAGPGF
ncbi:hypothetical protein EYF80_037626 [Liparis tanakae]|uniref:Uncharacterized protein n=1 Tax=Liparis tanakae TaxID=230148 RepID=A0A4Z2GF89_9TELE|nr:hypothetical protein EYF80_037626 [Liparis tanakae]